MVSWAGSDAGSGVRYYDIYASDNSGKYNLWQTKTVETSAYFQGASEHTYSFFSIATDWIGHAEALKNQAEASVLFKAGTGVPEVKQESQEWMIISPVPVRVGEPCIVRFNLPNDALKDFYLVVYSALGEKVYENHRLTPEMEIRGLRPGYYIMLLSEASTGNYQTRKVVVID